MGFQKHATALEGVFIIEPSVFRDSRGFFMELYNQQSFDEIGVDTAFMQDNLSASSQGTIRGMHLQAPPFAQAKLVTVLEGAVLDIVVDIRRSSASYGKHLAVELSKENARMLYLPEGMAHGFQVLSVQCLFHYKCSNVYHKASETGFAWNDSQLALPWDTSINPIISEKDQGLVGFEAFESPFL